MAQHADTSQSDQPTASTTAAGDAPDPERQEGSTQGDKRAPLTEPTTLEQSGASATREVAQSQPDRVAIVSRTTTGQAHQSPGYDVIGLPEDADDKLRAAAENRPEHWGA